MENSTNEIAIYIRAFKRRKWLFVIPAMITFCLASLVIVVLPSVYVSKATILVEGQEVPQELVQTTVTGYIEERLQSISQMAFNRKNLLGIIEQYNLYEDYRDSMTSEELLEEMRDSINVENIQANVVSNTGRETTATIAFSIAFEGRNPKQVLQTTNALVSLFLEENLREREEKALTTYEFLSKQLDQLRMEVQDVEARIANFKEENYRSLPELTELNLQTLERIQKEIDSRQEMIKTLLDRKVYLEGQLATVEPVLHSYSAEGQRILTSQEKVKSLRSQYLAAKATRSEKHPDMINLKGQIKLLENELSSKNIATELSAELESWKQKLAALEKRFTAKHPDVINARNKVALLVQDLEALNTTNDSSSLALDLDQENPAFINLKTQIHATDLEIRNERNLLAELKLKYEKYSSYIEQSPQVEQEYQQLRRDYENSSMKYQETMQKVLAARQAQELEKEHVSERLSLVEPPVLPEKPYKPKRLLLGVVAMILSIGLGVGMVSVAEILDDSVHDRESLARLTSVPVLGVIPYVQTAKEIAEAKKRKVLISGVVVIGAIGALSAIHFLIIPIDIVLYKFVDKLQRLV